MIANTHDGPAEWGFEITCRHCGCTATITLETTDDDKNSSELTRVACSNNACDQPDQVGEELSLKHKGLNVQAATP